MNGLFLEEAIKLFSKPPTLENFNYLNTKLQYFISQIKINSSSDAKQVKADPNYCSKNKQVDDNDYFKSISYFNSVLL